MRSADAPVDLRSDTVTRPDAPMLEAMVRAPLGDDVFGDDPTVQELEVEAAAVTGKEAALFVPSGTMANSIAVSLLTQPGDEILIEASCHTYNSECAGAAQLWGVQARPLPGLRGVVPLAAIEAAIRPADIHVPRTSLVVLEQTSNISGGCVLPLDYLESVGTFCRARDLSFHLDGARIFNAAVASGVPVSRYAAPTDTVMFCVSKGLGAPAGSLLAGTRDIISRARKRRKLLGGGMRQAGILAACGLFALRHNVERLRDDHRRARELSAALAALVPRGLEIEPPETNMVYLRWRGDDPARYPNFVRALREEGVLAVALGDRGVRLVLHKDIDDSLLHRAREVILRVLERTLLKG
jgi:threonine aldolase